MPKIARLPRYRLDDLTGKPLTGFEATRRWQAWAAAVEGDPWVVPDGEDGLALAVTGALLEWRESGPVDSYSELARDIWTVNEVLVMLAGGRYPSVRAAWRRLAGHKQTSGWLAQADTATVVSWPAFKTIVEHPDMRQRVVTVTTHWGVPPSDPLRDALSAALDQVRAAEALYRSNGSRPAVSDWTDALSVLEAIKRPLPVAGKTVQAFLGADLWDFIYEVYCDTAGSESGEMTMDALYDAVANRVEALAEMFDIPVEVTRRQFRSALAHLTGGLDGQPGRLVKPRPNTVAKSKIPVI